MTKKLRAKEKACLEEWIGCGPREFVLLYDVERDTCDPKIFHEKCDNKGPTLTLISNTAKCCYGGYTSVNWASSEKGQMLYDNRAFLFQLYVNDEYRPCKFPVIDHSSAIENNVTRGPTFGSGPDLMTFENAVAKAGNYTLNSVMKPTSYNMMGHTVESITGETFEVYNIQVFSVREALVPNLLPEPWRPVEEWNEQLLQKLKKQVEEYSPLLEIGLDESVMPHVNILLLGPIGAGKSSFFNTIDSIFRERMAMKARAGSLQNSLTKRFNSSDPISKDTCPKYIKDPGLEARIHCVVFVVDSNNVSTDAVDTGMDIMTEKVKEKVTKLQEIMNQKEIPQLILMNKIDGFCNTTGNNLKNIFYSPKVKQGVKKVAETLGLPEYTVLPMKNINCEQGPGIDTNVSILALYNLQQMLNAADDYLSYFLPELISEKIEYKFSKEK
ncbi:hypothetical protein KUTeg_009192 [Tegillarca granosa]|uniref:TLDc domain-containing protein n=1 Tax=Tegillarca granosa TaxID=220873 RepID=A0ABQ9FCA7_TEGGR|nr:hypothetical protein KUTeg_009192 [Tegillarca granosa]